ncbi:MAG: class I tRNA ligase family protein, partial [Patescibacteria group bacterium]
KANMGDEERVAVCERCETPVEKKDLEQWFFKITKYADRLLEDLKKIDWSEKVVNAQRNWIGKSEGIVLKFETETGSPIEVFTTRPDTFHGVTFIAISVYHPFLKSVKNLSTDVLEFVNKSKIKNKISKIDKGQEVSGVFTGHFVKHPGTGEKLPIWVADYVLMEYGEGAVMGVPAHDERDLRFAKKYDLPVKEIELENIEKVFEELEKKGIGKRKTNYHLRDWLISRQRYWGAPIPMINCPKCGWQPVSEKDLPVILPYIENFKPLGTHSAGHSTMSSDRIGSGQAVGPLAQDKDFVNTKCPNCQGPAKRETDVCDTFLDSSWYYLRYPSSSFDTVPFDKEITEKWLPVNMYIGGAEHSVLHLLYSRFIWKVLYDLGYLNFSSEARPGSAWDEPFPKFRAHGLLIKDGVKMSKSKGNIVNPDDYIVKFGTDILRCYLMFSGPFEQGGDFRDSGIEGMERFLKRVGRLINHQLERESDKKIVPRKNLDFAMNRAIKEVTEDVENLRYNTAIAHVMEYVNQISNIKYQISNIYLKTLILLLAPFAPFYAEEWWSMLGGDFSVHTQKWPEYDPKKVVFDTVTVAVQINGKTRDTIEIEGSKTEDQEFVEDEARKSLRIQKYLEGSQIKKVIYVPGKIINFVF